ncbi:MAG: leucyl/phenylalanyl-tRNA--protein transferase [Wenzhouxiangellaceae bacterium]|nr:leucyl/phenylalanyl-tRNA--protein transferase [Wenzhouxiangellaceae bacterium]
MRQFAVLVLDKNPDAPFPDPRQCEHPDGLVAVGGDLSRTRLLNAYRHGIFPWYEPGGPLLWWSPDPRAVLIPGHMHVSRRLARTLRQKRFEITVNRDFAAVVDGCAAPRDDAAGTWITPEMRRAYLHLHESGDAVSLEVRRQGRLVGGLYGVAIGRMFFAESKFHYERDASKIALVELMRRLEARSFLLCDCQLWNPHLEHFGVRMIDRNDFLRILRHGVGLPSTSLAEQDSSPDG